MGKTFRTGIHLILVLALIGIVTGSCRGERRTVTQEGPGSPQGTAAGSDKGKLKMHQLELAITLEYARVLPDESTTIQVALANKDSISIEVPRPESVCVFEFIVRSKQDSENVHFLDVASAFEAHTGDPKPPRDPEMMALDSGARAAYRYDLAQFYLAPLLPDVYDVSVRYRKGTDVWESPPVSLTVIPPRIDALAKIYGSTEQNLSLVFANREEDGSISICQRESFFNRPDCGILHRRVRTAPNQTVTGVADAIELYYNRGIRWFAWLEGDVLGAAVAQERTLFGQLDPVALGLQSPLLQGQGWQHEDELATFAVLGIDPAGRVAFAPVRLPLGEGESIKQIPLSFSKLPVVWRVRYRSEDEKAYYDIVAGEDRDGKTRLTYHMVDDAAVAAGPVVVLAEREEPLAALALEPVAGESAGVTDALFGPVGAGRQMTFVRLSLAGGEPVKEWAFNTPRDPENKIRPAAWAITAKPLAVPLVLVKFGDQLLARDVTEGAEWSTVADDAADANHLQLEVLGDGTVWAMWADPAIGIRYAAIR